MSAVSIIYECDAASAIAAGAPVTVTLWANGRYTVRAADAGAGDIVDGTATAGAANGDMVTVVAGPTFGQRLTE